MNTELEQRLDLIEFRQQLLFDNDSYSRLLFEYNVTREQSNAIYGLFDTYREQIDNGESVHHGSYEHAIYDIVPQHRHNYHFAESIAQTLHEQNRYEEVFEAVYGDSVKFQHYLTNHRS
jgi:hypothetical protein